MQKEELSNASKETYFNKILLFIFFYVQFCYAQIANQIFVNIFFYNLLFGNDMKSSCPDVHNTRGHKNVYNT